jgi:hypothetical protein
MSVRIDASGDCLTRSANVPTRTAFTACCWAKMVVDRNAFSTIMYLRSSGGTTAVAGLNAAADGVTVAAEASGSGRSTTVHTMVANQWFFAALKTNGTTITGLARAANVATLTTGTVAHSGTTVTGQLNFGDKSPAGGEFLNGSVAAIKVWDAVLTDAEILRESFTIRFQRKENLNFWAPCFAGVGERTRDYSGNARDLTAGGTLTDEEAPPVSWGGAPIIIWPTAAAPVTNTETLTLEAAAQKAITATASLDVAALKAVSLTGTLDAAAQQALSATSTLEAAARATLLATSAFETAAQKRIAAIAMLEAIAAPLTSFGAIPPEAILASTNLSGIVANIRDDPDAPDASWLTASSATAATDVRVSFSSPSIGVFGLLDFKTGNTERYYSIPNHSVLNLGAGAWAWGVWTKVADITGAFFQYVISNGLPTAANGIAIYMSEASVSGGLDNPGTWTLRMLDSAGVGSAWPSTTATGADNILRLIVVQSTGSTIEIWHCTQGGTAVRRLNQATDLGTLNAAVAWNFGRRTDGNADRYYESQAGGFFKADVALSQADVTAIAAPASPATVLGANCIAYWPFVNGATATETDVVSGLVATRQGTGW